MTRKTQILILTLLSVIFFFVYSSYLMGREVSFTAPDENINFFYTKYVGENHSIVYEDPLNESLDTTTIRPRGMRYHEGKIVPNLFLGMYFLYGGFHGVFSFIGLPDSAVLYLNPMFAVIGVWVLYFLVDEVFDDKTALVSACLLFVLPPYWYWGSLFFSNILGVVLFIAALLFSFKALNRERPAFYALAGLFYGLTLFVRPDFVYLYPSVVVLMIIRWRSIRIKYIGFAVVAFAISIAPLLLLNDYLYGGLLKTGHHVSLEWRGTVPPSGNTPNYLGANIGLVLSAVPLSVFSFGGFLYCLKKRMRLDYLLLLPIPIILFGYFFLTGQPGRFELIVHNSYVRYFIPIYVMMLPLFTVFLLRVVKIRCLVALALLVFIAFSVFSAYTGILDTRRSAIYYDNKATSIRSQTEDDAVIFCNSLDKILFPERKVALYNFSEEAIDNAASLSSRMLDMDLPVYLIIERPSTTNLFSRLLGKHGCKMSLIDPENSLYVLSETPSGG